MSIAVVCDNGNQMNVKMENKPETSVVKVMDLPLSMISFATYQRKPNEARCKLIADSFMDDRMHPIDVSYRDGSYWCYDGQHRVHAYKIMKRNYIPCIVHEGLTFQDEAYLFAHQNDNVGRITAAHNWKASLEAKEKSTVDIVRICKSYGFTVLDKYNAHGNNNFACVAELRNIYSTYGDRIFETLIKSIHDAWGTKKEKITDHRLIRAFSLFIGLYRASPAFNFKILTDKLSTSTPKQILQNASEHRVAGMHRKCALEMVDMYNVGLRGKKRLCAESVVSGASFNT